MAYGGMKEMEIRIRQEIEEDYKRVYEINEMAFGQENESKLIEKIRKGPNFVPELSLVAEKDNTIVGHILFSKIKIVGESEYETLMLAPLAVVPELQKQGIGGKLIKKGIENAIELGFESIIVVGHKDYYPKFGFQKASKWGIQSSIEVPDEAFMAIELTEKALENRAGVVQFPQEFMESE
jgi:putative acetyltransferase